MRKLDWFCLGAAGFFLVAPGCASTKGRAPIPQSALVTIRAAGEAIDAKNFDQAREQLKALKVMPRTAGLEEAIDSVEKRLAGVETAEMVRKASTLKIEPERVAYGQQVLVTLEIKNPTEQVLRFPARQSAVPLLRDRKDGGFYGRLTELAISSDAYGNQVRDKAEKTFSIDEEVIIAPGQSWVQQSRVTVQPDAVAALRVYQLYYFVRAPRAILGEQEIAFGELVVGPGSFQGMPVGYEPLAADPMASLKKALTSSEEKFDAHVFLCAVLAGKEKQKEAVRLLGATLSDPNPGAARRRAAMAGLRWLTGVTENGLEEDRWKAWWANRRKEYEEGASG